MVQLQILACVLQHSSKTLSLHAKTATQIARPAPARMLALLVPLHLF